MNAVSALRVPQCSKDYARGHGELAWIWFLQFV